MAPNEGLCIWDKADSEFSFDITKEARLPSYWGCEITTSRSGAFDGYRCVPWQVLTMPYSLLCVSSVAKNILMGGPCIKSTGDLAQVWPNLIRNGVCGWRVARAPFCPLAKSYLKRVLFQADAFVCFVYRVSTFGGKSPVIPSNVHANKHLRLTNARACSRPLGDTLWTTNASTNYRLALIRDTHDMSRGYPLNKRGSTGKTIIRKALSSAQAQIRCINLFTTWIHIYAAPQSLSWQLKQRLQQLKQSAPKWAKLSNLGKVHCLTSSSIFSQSL